MEYERKQYLEQLIKKKDNGRVKVITGLRRSGKSYLFLLKNGRKSNNTYPILSNGCHFMFSEGIPVFEI